MLDVFANDDHALMLLHHAFDRDGEHREYGTAHIPELRDGSISKGTEQTLLWPSSRWLGVRAPAAYLRTSRNILERALGERELCLHCVCEGERP